MASTACFLQQNKGKSPENRKRSENEVVSEAAFEAIQSPLVQSTHQTRAPYSGVSFSEPQYHVRKMPYQDELLLLRILFYIYVYIS